ncbi:MAG: TlpA disulfide reductase family protein [Kiloniellaceae bacterium]
MLSTVGVIRKTLAAVGLATLVLAQSFPATAREQLSASGGKPSAPEGPFAENFTFSDPPVPAPSVGFETLQGEPVTLADFEGQVVLVNFWATWCAPCVEEMPSLERLHQALVGEGFAVLAVSQDRGGSTAVAPFLGRLDLQQLPVYLDSMGVLARAFALKGLPTSFLIDREGRVRAGLVGPAEWDSQAAMDFIRHYLGGEAGAPDGDADLTNTSG